MRWLVFLKQKTKWFLILTLGYGCFYWINNTLTSPLYLETGAHIIHLPSGVRMVLVLIAGKTAAIALMVATFPYAYLGIFSGNFPLALITSVATGLIPITTIYLVRQFTLLDEDLSTLNPQKLLAISIVYAAINSITQQSLIFIFGMSQNPLNAVLVMFTGDILGIFIVLYAIKIIGKVIEMKHKGSS